jgi:ABC-2 type transport system ATP-binding protein
VQTATSIASQIVDLNAMLEIEEFSDTWLRFRTRRPAETNPALLRRLHAAGVPVISLSEVPRSLETVYLRIVGENQPERMAGVSEAHEVPA